MQIVSLDVRGLFGRFDHHVDFPTPDADDREPSLTLLYGPNGVGKTILLQMIDGLMGDVRVGQLDVFRRIPFATCELSLTGLQPFRVERIATDEQPALRISFGGVDAKLGMSTEDRSSLSPSDEERSDFIMKSFAEATSEVSFEFIDTSRIERPLSDDDLRRMGIAPGDRALRTVLARQSATARRRASDSLAGRMARFIDEAQLDFRQFFGTDEPDLFARIIERVAESGEDADDATDLLARLTAVRDQDSVNSRLGLRQERWDYELLVNRVKGASPNTLAVVAGYLEVLEARTSERSLLADRLRTFERLMREFFIGKTVTVAPREGLHIETDDGAVLREQDLSSGEHQLLYLMVSAVLARREGTVLAIDEPELSMHIEWQRKLVPALLECVSGAEPQFILATHSPDLAAEYPDSLIELMPQ